MLAKKKTECTEMWEQKCGIIPLDHEDGSQVQWL